MKPKAAKLKSCVKQDSQWVATDTAGRRFIAESEKEALRMLTEYNAPRKP